MCRALENDRPKIQKCELHSQKSYKRLDTEVEGMYHLEGLSQGISAGD